MALRRSLGRQFGWLWAAFAVSTVGSTLALNAFPLIAILVLHTGPAGVSALAAAGLAVGAVIAIPLGPWVEFRRKRPVMIAMDLLRFVALASVPVTFALGWLSYLQLLAVSVVVAAASIAFRSASGACLKSLVAPEHLLLANGRFEATTWTATALGPPLGGAAIGLFGPLTTVLADAVSYLLSAAGLGAIGGREPHPARSAATRLRARDLAGGWRYILEHRGLRLMLANSCLVNALIMVSAPLLSVLMLGQLGFAPWQFGLGFGLPCIGGLIGSRLSPGLVARFGQHRVMVTSGVLRACWPVGLALVGRGTGGLVLVIVIELGLITCCSVFNPVLATYRLEQTANDRVARTLSAWTVSTNLSTAILTGLWGLLASLTSPRIAIGLAGLLMLATPALLPYRAQAPRREPELART